IDHKLTGRALPLGLGIVVIGICLAALTAYHTGPVTGVITAIVLGVGYGTVLVTGLARVQRIAPPHELAGLTGLFYALTYFGFLFPTFIAALVPIMPYHVTLLIFAGLALISMIIAFGRIRYVRGPWGKKTYSLGCWLRKNTRLPSRSASSHIDGASAWLIIFPPASTAACIRVTANSAGTKTSTCILTGPSEGSTSSTGIVLSGRCKNRIGLSTSDRSTNISVWPEPSASLKSKTAFQNGLMASILGVTKIRCERLIFFG